ncbi:MATE family efflux transporter [Anaerosporomusa subterranea]|uniref:Multidrug export protein MepA n=1 Tax=Anaerosporomusa subterranea TaxID=1794912 RepID=A0A154BWK3_ANASB|nr:MATE family efflux transporter [Anaerosporomusa subterranea]KYZ78170.1 MATE family efflux transporter [Anaerosporomusa subterranea]
MNATQALGQEPVGKLLWQFSLPAIVGMLVNALYNVVDSIFVGNGVGEIGLTAVTIAFPIMLVMMAFGMLIGVGASTLVSIRLGEHNKAEAEYILGNALTMIAVLSLLLSVIGLVWLDPLLVALGAEPEVLPYARTFTRIILIGNVFMHVGFGLNNIIRAEGNPRLAMATMLISAMLNVVLNPLFLFVMNLGIGGSALATVISQFVSAVWVLSHFLNKGSLLKFRLRNLRPNWRIVKDIIAIGMSPFFMQLAASVVTVLYNFGLIRYGGDLAVAAMGIVNRITMLMLMPIFGISQGAQPIIGYNYGARQYDRVFETVKKAIYAASGLSFIGFLIVQIFNYQIVGLFNNNSQLIALGGRGLSIMLSMLPIIGFQAIAAQYFQAVGKARYALLFTMSRQVLILIPMILLLPKFFGLTGIWLAGPTADVAAAVLTGIYLYRELRTLKVM